MDELKVEGFFSFFNSTFDTIVDLNAAQVFMSEKLDFFSLSSLAAY